MHFYRPTLSLISTVALPLVLVACSQATGGTPAQAMPDSDPVQASMSCIPVERVEVVHFHATQQCISCIAVGRLAKETLKESFSAEMESGRVIFRDVNGELPENSEIVLQYQARGSSLFTNAISQGQEHVEEDTTVWRLYANEEQYKEYFERKIRDLLSCAS